MTPFESAELDSRVSDDALETLNGVCGLRTFQLRHAARESNQSLTGSWLHMDASGYLEVLMTRESPFVILWRWRPSKCAHASTRASGETVTCQNDYNNNNNNENNNNTLGWTLGPLADDTNSFLAETGRRATLCGANPQKAMFLYQHDSVVIQHFNTCLLDQLVNYVLRPRCS